MLKRSVLEKGGREDEQDERLLAAATEVFLEKGFSATSVDEIAARAKASKITFYNHYGNKEQLFENVVLRQNREIFESFAASLRTELTLNLWLLSFARKIISVLLTTEKIKFVRLLHSEAERFPRFAEVFEKAGPHRAMLLLADHFDKEMVAGRLRRADPKLAAEQFIHLSIGELSRRIMLGLRPYPAKAEIEKRITSAIDVFMRAYAPE